MSNAYFENFDLTLRYDFDKLSTSSSENNEVNRNEYRNDKGEIIYQKTSRILDNTKKVPNK